MSLFNPSVGSADPYHRYSLLLFDQKKYAADPVELLEGQRAWIRFLKQQEASSVACLVFPPDAPMSEFLIPHELLVTSGYRYLRGRFVRPGGSKSVYCQAVCMLDMGEEIAKTWSARFGTVLRYGHAKANRLPVQFSSFGEDFKDEVG